MPENANLKSFSLAGWRTNLEHPAVEGRPLGRRHETGSPRQPNNGHRSPPAETLTQLPVWDADQSSWNEVANPQILQSRPSLGHSILIIAHNAAGRDRFHSLGSASRAVRSVYKSRTTQRDAIVFHSLASASRAVRSVYKSPEPDVIHEPQHQKHRYNIRSAGTHQRQWNTGDRHPSHHHSDIDQHVEQQ